MSEQHQQEGGQANVSSFDRLPKVFRRKVYERLGEVYRRIMGAHKSLKAILEFEVGPGIRHPSDKELLHLAGYNSFEPDYSLAISPEKGYSADITNVGGFVMYAKDKKGRTKTFIFLRRDVTLPEWAITCVNTAVAFHEEKHVDQFEKNEFTTTNGLVDMDKAEFDAHEHACATLLARKEHEALGFYLASLHQHVAAMPGRADAARQFVESESYGIYKAAAGQFFEQWCRSLPTDKSQWYPEKSPSENSTTTSSSDQPTSEAQ